MSLQSTALQQEELLFGPPSNSWLREALPDERISSFTPADFWYQLATGTLQLTATHSVAHDRTSLVARNVGTAASGAALSSRESEVFGRLLTGQAQKAMGYELNVCPSTVATHIARAYAKLGLVPLANAVPLALVFIAQGARGAIHLTEPFFTASLRSEQRYVVVNIARPAATCLSDLTCAERAVALALADGQSKIDIARARCTSVHTIGRQVSSLFGKLNVKGRFDLIRRMSDSPHHPAMSTLST